MLRRQKEAIVEETARLLAGSEALFVSDYRGLTVAELGELRGALREHGAAFRVLKNTLTRRAAGEAGREEITGLLSGPTAVTFCGGDPAAAARALVEFGRTHQQVELRGGYMQGAVIDSAMVRTLSALPSREVLIAQVVGTMAAPITGLVTVLQGTISGLVRSLRQISEQKAAGEA